jgi:hypothetical protein
MLFSPMRATHLTIVITLLPKYFSINRPNTNSNHVMSSFLLIYTSLFYAIAVLVSSKVYVTLFSSTVKTESIKIKLHLIFMFFCHRPDDGSLS